MSRSRSLSVAISILGAALAPANAVAAPESGETIDLDAGLSTGSWPDSVEIDVPPGPGGGKPSVALVADHRAPDGVAGSGWRLVAGGAITRHSSRGGAPNHTATDLYRLDGTDLVWVTAPGAAHYQPETWDGSRLTYVTASNTWTRQREGWTFVYGTAAGTGVNATRLLADAGQTVTRPMGGTCTTNLCATSIWYLSKVTDPFGNVTKYDYRIPVVPTALAARYPWTSTRTHLLDKITYGTLKVEFAYDPRPDTRLAAVGGRAALATERLRQITSKVGTATYARYVIQYEGETAAGVITAPLTDCDGVVANADDTIEQSLIQKIVRVGASVTPQHTLRCVRSHHELTTWQGDGDAEVLAEIDAPGFGTQPLAQSAVPLAVNLDRDAITDLIVLGMTSQGAGGIVPTHRAYVATPNQPQRFAPAGAAGPGAVAAAWQAQLEAVLDGNHLSAERGYALTDLDGDLEIELVYEDSSGAVWADHRAGAATVTFTTSATGLTGCDLRYADFDDVDGDGKVDAIIKSHAAADGCGAQTTTTWIRNTGTAPWLSSTSARSLTLPLESALTTPEWLGLFSSVGVCAGGLLAPTDYNSRWSSTVDYKSDHARLGDLNGDGVVDLSYALYGCWTKTNDDIATTDDNETTWEPIPGSAYSRVFFGDGNGGWIDSGLSAGPPLTYDFTGLSSSGPDVRRLTSGVVGAVDVDRNGLPELMTTTMGSRGTRVMISPFHSLAAGFGVVSDPTTNAVEPTTNVERELYPAGLDNVGRGGPCYERSHAFTLGDFDGDGHVDVLTLELEAEGGVGTTLCPAGQWCAVLRTNQRTAVEGRLISSDGPFGGRTALTWGFVGQGEHSNPNLQTNVEVVERIDGAEGVVTLTYSDAFTIDARPSPFAAVVRVNARGGRDAFGFVTARWAEGKPSHAARFRTDGSLEHVTVYSYGAIGGGGVWLYTAAPYFAPLARQCDYQVGHPAGMVQTVTIGDLIERCYQVGGAPPLPPGTTDRPGSVFVSTHQIPMALGQTSGQIVPGGSTVYAAVFGATAHSYGGISVADAWTYSPPWATVDLPASFWRWPTPANLANAVPDVAAAEAGYTAPPGALPTEVVEFVEDWSYDLANRVLLLSIEHRDTATTTDDRHHNYLFTQVSPSGHWYRLAEERIRDGAGAELQKVTRAYPSATSYTPSAETVCGPSAASCHSTLFDVGPTTGDLRGRTYADGASESWVRGTCGLATSHTDQANRVRELQYTTCRVRQTRFEGGQQDWLYDGLGRVTRLTTTPGGGGAVTVVDTYYDDALAYREDQYYLEPRVARRRSDGLLELIYLDGFGRTTKRIECEAGGSTAGHSGVLASVNCKPNTRRTVEWNLYGSDGLRKVETEPFFDSETPVTHGRAHDGLGRVAVTLAPAHTTTGPGWLTEIVYRGPSWQTVIDPVGRALKHTFTTLETERFVDGIRRSTERYDVQARLVEHIGSDGRSTRRSYDDSGNLARIWRVDPEDCVDASGAVVVCLSEHRYTAHDGLGRVLSERDAALTVTSYTYDGLGRPLTRTLQPAGQPAVVLESRSYTGATPTSPATTTITDEAGVTTTTTLDGLDRPLTTDVLEVSTAVTWGVNGQPRTAIDRNGRTTEYRYDTYDRVQRVVAPGGVHVDQAHDGAGRLISVTDADGVVITHGYTYSGRLATTMRAGRWTEVARSYDAAGRVIAETVDGVASTLGWDELDRLEVRDDGVSATGAVERTRMYYDDGDRLIERTVQPRGRPLARTTYHHDAWGRLVRTTDPALADWRSEFDVLGRTRRVIDPLGNALTTEYDARGRVTAQQHPGGWDYHAYHAGRSYTPVTTTTPITGLYRHDQWDSGDAAGVKTKTYTDALGRMVATVHKNDLAVEHTWSGDELVTELWRESTASTTVLQQRDHLRNDRGWIERIEGPYRPGDPETTIDWIQLGYTAAGREQSRTTPHLLTTFTYDGGLLASESWNDQVRTLLRADTDATWVTAEEWRGASKLRRRDDLRDDLGRIVVTTTTAVGRPTTVVTRSGFDGFGNPDTEIRTVDGVIAATTTWSYDDAGRPRTRTVTPRGGSAMVTDWRWNANGALAEVTTPSGVTTAYDYGGDLLIDRVYDPAVTGARAVVTSRNGRGQITGLNQPADSTARGFTYDVMGRRDSEGQGPMSGLPTTSWVRVFDPLGRIETEQHVTASSSWTDEYTYDGRGRLLTEIRGPAADVRSYHWSVGGNLERVDRPLGTGWETIMSATYDGQRATAVDGTALSYDSWQHVVTDQRGTAFAYDADGETRSVTGAGASPVELVRDADGIPVAHLEGGAVARQLAWDLDTAGLPLEVQQSDGVDRTYVGGLGELLGVTTSTGFTSAQTGVGGRMTRLGGELLTSGTAFGDGVPAPVGVTAERFGFGQLESVAGAPGVLLARHRIYDPATARFLSPDPIGLAGGEHRFSYADGDPVQKRDPLGYSACFAEVANPPSFVPERLTFRSYEAMSSPVPSAVGLGQAEQVRLQLDIGQLLHCGPGLGGCDGRAPTGPHLPIPFGAPGVDASEVDPQAWQYAASDQAGTAEELVVYARQLTPREERRLARRQARAERRRERLERRLLRRLERLAPDGVAVDETGSLVDTLMRSAAFSAAYHLSAGYTDSVSFGMTQYLRESLLPRLQLDDGSSPYTLGGLLAYVMSAPTPGDVALDLLLVSPDAYGASAKPGAASARGGYALLAWVLGGSRKTKILRAFAHADQFLLDEVRSGAAVKAFDKAVRDAARRHNLPTRAAAEHVLRRAEIAQGFGEPLILKNKIYRHDRFAFVLRRRRPVVDPTFGADWHSDLGHRVQMWALARELKRERLLEDINLADLQEAIGVAGQRSQNQVWRETFDSMGQRLPTMPEWWGQRSSVLRELSDAWPTAIP